MRFDVLAPPQVDEGNPVGQIVAGAVLTLGAIFAGERLLRWWRKRSRAGVK